MNFSSSFVIFHRLSLFFTNICSFLYGCFYNFYYICTTIHHQLYIITTKLKIQDQAKKNRVARVYYAVIHTLDRQVFSAYLLGGTLFSCLFSYLRISS